MRLEFEDNSTTTRVVRLLVEDGPMVGNVQIARVSMSRRDSGPWSEPTAFGLRLKNDGTPYKSPNARLYRWEYQNSPEVLELIETLKAAVEE